MEGMKVLLKEEKKEIKGGKCPYTPEYIKNHIRELMEAGKVEAAEEFIRITYELGC